MMSRVLTVVAAVAMGLPSVAWACGGFFCDAQTPVDQSSEDILFTVDEDASVVRAIVRIQYEGPPAAFSWILPMPSAPEVSVGTDAVFEAIRSVSDVSFNTTFVEHNCNFDDRNFGGGVATSAPQAEEGAFDAGGVDIVEVGQAGPYDFVVLTADDAQTLVDWLEDKDYQVPTGSTTLMDHYIAQDMVFIAVKLQATASTGDISPIVLELDETEPCVPLVLTSVAARPNMPIRVWVASNGQAIPRNWFGVQPNWTRLNWIDPGADGPDNGQFSYPNLITRAVDEAAGHGFVTEYLDSTNDAAQALRDGLAAKSQIASAASVEDVLSATWSIPGARVTPAGGFDTQLAGWVAAAMAEALPLPEGVDASPTEFYSQDWLYWDQYALVEFDAETVQSVFNERIFDPLEDTEEWVSEFSTLTRIFTTVSPEEMNRDPMFHLRSEWQPVSPVHSATIYNDCEGTDVTQKQIVELDDGSRFEIPEAGVSLPWQNLESFSRSVTVEMPDNVFLVQPDDVAFIDDQFNTVTGALATEGLQAAAPYQPRQHVELSAEGSDDGGCRANRRAPSGSGLAWLAVGMLAAVGLRRRFASA